MPSHLESRVRLGRRAGAFGLDEVVRSQGDVPASPVFSLRRPRLLADYVPWRYPISDHAMLLDGGHVLAVFALDGLACETLHDDQIAHAHVQRNDLIRNIAFDGLTLTAYECRATADPADYLHKGTGFRSGYAEALDLAYREQLYDGLLYSNPLFLAVQVGPARPFGDFVGSRVERRQEGRRRGDSG